MLSSMKKKKSSDQQPKKRSQWKKQNHSVLQPSQEEVGVPDVPPMARKDSAKTKQAIMDTRRKMREDIKKNNKRKSDFDVVIMGGDGSHYVPTAQEKKAKPEKVTKPQESKESVVETQPTRRVKKEWNKNPKPEVKPVQDHSQERKEWKRPAPIPKEPKKEPNFEVHVVSQDEAIDVSGSKPESVTSNVKMSKKPSEDRAPYYPQPHMQFTSELDQDHFQFERMVEDMKNNLFSLLVGPEEDTTQLETSMDEPEEESGDELKASEPKVEELPDISKEEEEDRDDFDAEDAEVAEQKAEDETLIKEEAQMKSVTFGGNIAEVMNVEKEKVQGEKIDQDLSRYNTIERIKDYLEQEIGKEMLDKAHPILKEFGDEILYESNIPLVIDKLDGILSEEEVVQYLHFFATLVFFENEQDKIMKKKKEKTQKKPEKENKPDFNAKSFKDIDMDEGDETNIFKKYANQNPSFDMTATFGFQ